MTTSSVKTVLLTLLFLTLICAVYFLVLISVNKNIFAVSYVPYYNYLTEAFLDKRTFIVNPPTAYDLTSFNGMLYLYWGPTPVLFVLPFYLLGGLFTSDVIYTFFAGFLNVVLFFLTAREAAEHFGIKRKFGVYVLTLFYALTSPNLYLAMGGRVWHTNQIISVFYLLIFLIFIFKYLNSRSKTLYFLLGNIFFVLAWMSRSTLFFYAILIFYVIYLLYKDKRTESFKKAIFITILVNMVGLFLFFAYNYFRFGNFLETGITYQLSDPRFSTAITSGQFLSFRFFIDNFQHYFLEHAYLLLKAPFIKANPEGNSIFSVYIFSILFLLLFGKKIFEKNRIFLSFSIIAITGIISFLLLFMGTGWTQFGSRYFFDAVPLMLLSLLFVINEVPRFLVIGLLIYGFVVNYFGTLYFYNNF